MTGLDTNILARFFTQDEPEQSSRADAFLQLLTPENPGFISLVVVVELIWVLRSRYGITKPVLVHSLRQLLDSPELVMDSPAVVTQALERYGRCNGDFADCLIESAGRLAGCAGTVTFDKNAAASAGMRLL